MIGYVTLGTNDLPRAGAFYDKLLSVIGAKRTMESDRFVAWGVGRPSPRSVSSCHTTATPPQPATAR
jgi:catechol 2,3-dioxygenase-like lactoylglutathione lyase family enzyme